jgi:hypothetical protein
VKCKEGRVEERDIIRTAAAVKGNCRAPTRSNEDPSTDGQELHKSIFGPLLFFLGSSLHLANNFHKAAFHLSRPLSYLDRLHHPWHAYRTPFRLLPLAVSTTPVHANPSQGLRSQPHSFGCCGPRITQHPSRDADSIAIDGGGRGRVDMTLLPNDQVGIGGARSAPRTPR